MNLRGLIGRFLAVFVIVGLLVAPLVGPAAAERMASVGMNDMAAMSGDMQCCPDGQKNKSCHDCPLVAMCMLSIAQAEPALASIIHVDFQIHKLSFALEDLTADGLIGIPPDHPPRILT